ncbi:UDP-N-acetyl-D-mannosamine dehydrogenase [Fluoribacter gormanii]|nr:UDP-N-acetyl-D-mannosamine dehydrogenase [Fluoribacter gormanii]
MTSIKMPSTMPFHKIAVIGLGYIGLPTAAILAARKIHVVGVDINQNAVDVINSGNVHIVEPELDIIVRAVVSDGYLRATNRPEPADVFLIAVPTPFKENYEPDLSYVKAASMSLAPFLKKGDLVILESTSPVGTTEKMASWLAQERPDLMFPHIHGEDADIQIAYCPERVLPGHVLHELVQNDRVIGGISTKCSEKAALFYKTFVEGECILTNSRTAEMCKLAENSFRDVNIAFANELSIICDQLQINVWELIRLANRHPRVRILQPGPGVGGHCIAVDPWFIVNSCPEHAKLIRTAREVNDGKPEWVIDKVKTAVADFLQNNPEKTIKDVTIACWGLSFKADIDDLRESPALQIVSQISAMHKGYTMVVEPNISLLPEVLSGNVMLSTMEHAYTEADIILLLVDHRQFRELPPERVRDRIVLDMRGIWFQ